MSSVARPRRRVLRWTLGSLVLLVLLVAGIAWKAVLDAAVTAPWAWPPGPRLTTTWTGSFTTPSGKQGSLFLDLERASTNGDYQRTPDGRAGLTGTGAFCVQGSPPLALDVSGSANRSGSSLRLTFVGSPTTTDGLTPNPVDGAFEGDRVVLSGGLTLLRAGTSVAERSLPDTFGPTSYELRRGSRVAHDAACA